MSMELWIVYLIASLGLSLTPGPNGLLALTSGARFGFRPSVFTVLGGALGFFCLIAVSLAGIGALLLASTTAFTVAKWAGAAYLAYLGIRLWRAPAINIDPNENDFPRSGVKTSKLFMEGFMVSVSNPKAIIFFAAFLPQFMVPGVSYSVQLLVLGGTFVVVEVAYELILAGLAGRIAPFLTRYGRAFNRITGGMFVGIGAVMAAAHK
ncbi:LysE family translocator [Notoacmeibacter sp. MSK16QG-6]|uniref:LysE family translocator n=1 Tax=Notoacmeibacter sp. MSK16QG-6 TaxID=2957982 RepID=UPI0020A036F8|nr:LysE family transporter [Notoacmeibacter sp. MSK16QG-6]MCP1200110.1 LysE family transporter [Notoacmeibacter sp. MSK16QG-6]